ncbi:MAG TPA: TonB-dependent receptor [Stellaceae bacterium]|nr:TonB-dependent receptor [Stellaceae bacterium]
MPLGLRSLYNGAALSLALIPGLAAAQSAPPPPAPEQSAQSSDQEGQLQEIVVTAQKRTESITKVPISIMAIDQETMDKQGVKDFTDVARLVPGLTFQPTDDAGDNNIAIRGISSDVGSATTGIYIDDTPVQVRPDAVGSNPLPKIFDLDRLEVLRGPQGTLFGAGAEGGAIRFITPEANLQSYSGFARGEIAFTDGGDPSYEVGAAVGGPIVQGKVGFRASAWFREDGGYIDRVDPATNTVVDTNTNSTANMVAHVAFKIAPTDELVITPSLFFQREHSDDASVYWESLGPYKEFTGMPQPSNDRFLLPVLGITYDLDAFNVKLISSYLDRDLHQQYNATNYEVASVGPNLNSVSVPGYPGYLVGEETRSGEINFTQEIRFTSNDTADSMFSWIGGLFYGHYRANYSTAVIDPQFNILSNQDIVQCLLNNANSGIGYDTAADNGGVSYCPSPGSGSLGAFGEAPLPGNLTYVDHFIETETDKAIFGNITYQPIQGLKLSAGVRVAQAGFTFLDEEDGPWGPAGPFVESGSAKETPVTPRFTANYQITDNQMVYATAAKGYRIGGANEPVPYTACQTDLKTLGITQVPDQYLSDSTWSYEAGLKGRFFDNKVLFEGSIYWVEWSGIQQEVFLPTCDYYYISNLGQAESRGFDIQAEWAVNKHLTLSGTASFDDARYEKTLPVPNTSPAQYFAKSGDPLPTPEWSATLSAEYTTQLLNNTDDYFRVDYSFQGPYYRFGSSETFSYVEGTRNAPASHYVTLRIGAKWDTWDVSLFADNLLNSDTSLFRYRDSSTTYAFRDLTFRPLTMGLTAEYKF